MTGHISTQEAVEAWKIAHRFVLDVYKLSNKLPREEHYGLIPKVRTSSVKIASNIVEGYARKSNEFYLRHLSESQVALEETKYSLLVARDLGYISDQKYDHIMNDAEALSDRLEGLQSRLSVGESEGLASSAPASEGLFATTHGVRDALKDAWDWFTGRKERLQQRRREKETNVWIEENPRSYLGGPDT